MTSKNCSESKENHSEKDQSLLQKSINIIGTMGMSLATVGLISTEAQAVSQIQVINEKPSSNSTPIVNPPKVNKPVKIKSTVKLSPPKISVPSNSNIRRRNVNQRVKNGYLDTTNYTRKVTPPKAKTPPVIVRDRKTGCKTIANNGSINNGNCGRKKVAPVVTRPTRNNNIAYSNKSNQTKRNYTNYNRKNLNQKRNYQKSYAPKSYYNNNNNNVVKNTLPPEYNYASRIKNIEANGNTSLLFPLSIPSRISSTFGWRIHPISGNRAMHYGTDIAAPMGTPVIASYDGEVAIADDLSGYGLTVILRHENGTQESRYGHLSEIFVNQGESISKGSVIGLVGSTGFSTGPHLHFEWRHLTQNGWIAVDAGLHLQYALDNLIKSMETAKINPNSNSDS